MKLKGVKTSVCFNEELFEWLHFMLYILYTGHFDFESNFLE